MSKPRSFQTLAPRVSLPFLIYNLSFFIFNWYLSAYGAEPPDD
jgi:hypothetical protein